MNQYERFDSRVFELMSSDFNPFTENNFEIAMGEFFCDENRTLAELAKADKAEMIGSLVIEFVTGYWMGLAKQQAERELGAV